MPSSSHSHLVRAGQFAQVARQGAVMLVALALPRMGFGRAFIGEWESLLYLSYLLGFGWLTGLLQSYLVEVRLRSGGAALRFSRWALVIVGGIAAGLLGLAALFHGALFAGLQLGDAPAGWWWFFVFLLTQWPGLFYEQVLLARSRPWWLAGFGAVSGLGFVVALLLPLYLGEGLTGALGWLAFFGGMKALIILGMEWWEGRKEGARPRVQGEKLAGAIGGGTAIRTWLRRAFPLIIYASLGAAVTAFDPWFVGYWYDGDEDVFATFRYGIREIPLFGALTSGLILAAIPTLTKSREEGLALLHASSRKLYTIGFGGAGLLILTSPLWWGAVFTETFLPSLPLFQLFLLITVARLLFPMPVIVALGHTKFIWAFSVVELGMKFLLASWWVISFGLEGVVLASVVADVINNAALMGYLYWKTGIGPGRYMDVRWFLGWSVFLVGCYVLVGVL